MIMRVRQFTAGAVVGIGLLFPSPHAEAAWPWQPSGSWMNSHNVGDHEVRLTRRKVQLEAWAEQLAIAREEYNLEVSQYLHAKHAREPATHLYIDPSPVPALRLTTERYTPPVTYESPAYQPAGLYAPNNGACLPPQESAQKYLPAPPNYPALPAPNANPEAMVRRQEPVFGPADLPYYQPGNQIPAMRQNSFDLPNGSLYGNRSRYELMPEELMYRQVP